MSTMESLDGTLFEPLAQDEADRLAGGALGRSIFGQCTVGSVTYDDYGADDRPPI
jgi:hypothetical protein